MRGIHVFPLLAAASASLAAPSFQTMVKHEMRSSLPFGFEERTDAPPDNKTMKFIVYLKSNNIQGLEDELKAVSSPDSKRYGQWLTKAAVEEYVRPTEMATSAVNDWLISNNITFSLLSATGDRIEILTTQERANELLGADFRDFVHVETGMIFRRTMAYSLPSQLKEHIDFVHPTISFPSSRMLRGQQPKKRQSDQDSSNFTIAITPALLQSLYSVPTSPARQSSNRVGVTAYEAGFARESDLSLYLQTFRPNSDLSATFSFESIDGGINDQNVSSFGEVPADIQIIAGLASNVPIILLANGGGVVNGTNVDNTFSGLTEYFLRTNEFLLNRSNEEIPQVISSSWSTEHEEENSFEMANKLCSTFLQLAARGISMIFSSGDAGVEGGLGFEGCLPGDKFAAPIPAGCPYVTVVGGTMGGFNGSEEVAAGLSGGGFSNYFARAWYQDHAVSRYLDTIGDLHSGAFNSSGRGFPDIAAQSVNFTFAIDGEIHAGFTGTSASAPTFSAIIALLNDRLVAAGVPVLGFLNPWLYQRGMSMLNDITVGENFGCAFNSTGFPAKQGWDPVTGNGTPNFERMLGALGLRD